MRIEGWESMLVDYIRSLQSVPFVWGENDCSLFVARWVDMVTGTSYASEWEGLYNTECGAYALMTERGYSTPMDITTENLTPSTVKMAKRGDIVAMEGGCLGICDGRKSWFFVEGKGLCALPTLKSIAAWGV